MESAAVSAETIPAKFHPSKSFLIGENRSKTFSHASRALTNSGFAAVCTFSPDQCKNASGTPVVQTQSIVTDELRYKDTLVNTVYVMSSYFLTYEDAWK